MERTLVILIGNARGGEETWGSMYQNLLRPYRADLALLFSKTEDHSSSLYSRAQYVWELEEYTDWYDYYATNCEGSYWFDFFQANQESGIGGGIRNFKGSGAIIFAFRHYLKKNFLSVLSQYNRIILTRSDFYYIDKHPLLPNNGLYVVEGEDYGGITDRHHIFPSHMSEKVLGIVEYILSRPNNLPHGINPEALLLRYFQASGAASRLYRCKRVQFTVATDKDSTRWCGANELMPGSSTIKLKYTSEYDKAMSNKMYGWPDFTWSPSQEE
jgi:hypothetical protein